MTPGSVLPALGDKFALSLSSAVKGARGDLDWLRSERAEWFPPMTNRGLANLIWERVWARLCDGLRDVPEANIVQSGSTNEIFVGLNFVIRVKRHTDANTISTYATPTAMGFYEQEQPALDGMAVTSLAVGYLWDPETKEIREPVVSYRDGKDNPIWIMRLDEPGDGAQAVTWTPIEPVLPIIYVGDVDETDETATDER